MASWLKELWSDLMAGVQAISSIWRKETADLLRLFSDFHTRSVTREDPHSSVCRHTQMCTNAHMYIIFNIRIQFHILLSIVATYYIVLLKFYSTSRFQIITQIFRGKTMCKIVLNF